MNCYVCGGSMHHVCPGCGRFVCLAHTAHADSRCLSCSTSGGLPLLLGALAAVALTAVLALVCALALGWIG